FDRRRSEKDRHRLRVLSLVGQYSLRHKRGERTGRYAGGVDLRTCDLSASVNRAVAHIGDLTTPIIHRSSALEVPVAAVLQCSAASAGASPSSHNIAASVVSDRYSA